MIIKLVGMIYGRHSTIYRRMIDEKERKEVKHVDNTNNNTANYSRRCSDT